jgi:hypothetical protein
MSAFALGVDADVKREGDSESATSVLDRRLYTSFIGEASKLLPML